MPFQPPSQPFPRRALLLVPVAFAGLAAVLWPRERTLPDAAQDGAGPVVPLALFSTSGTRQTVRGVRKLVQSQADWQKTLTSEEYAITRLKGTEFAFANRYWNEHRSGLYRCVCCGNALFRSSEKFASGTGWPSFSSPIAVSNIYTQIDTSHSMQRVEVLCRKCDAHLGHLFDDGPLPSKSRYCLNSAALRFVAYT